MSSKAVDKAVQALETALGLVKSLRDSGAQEKPVLVKAAPKSAKTKAPKAEKPAKAPTTVKERAQAALAAGKFKGNTKEGKTLKAFLTTKVKLTTKEGREMSAQVASLLGLPAPKKPGRAAKGGAPKAEAPKAKAKAEEPTKKVDGRSKAARAVKAAKGGAPKAPKVKAEKKAKAPKTPSTLKEHAEAALAEGKFKGNTKEGKALKEFIESKVDGRSAEGRATAIEVSGILGLPPPKKPGPAPKAAKAKAPKAEKPAKAANSGKGQEDSASDAPTPSPKTPAGAKPRAIDAVEMVLGKGTMNTSEVIAALGEKGWTPDSGNLKQYIGFILSQNSRGKNRDLFERAPGTPSGYYRVKVPTVPEAKVTSNGNGTHAEEAVPAPSVDLPPATDDDNPFEDADPFVDSVLS